MTLNAPTIGEIVTDAIQTRVPHMPAGDAHQAALAAIEAFTPIACRCDDDDDEASP